MTTPAQRAAAEADDGAVLAAMRGRPPMRVPDIARLAGLERARTERALRRLGRQGMARRVLLDIAGSRRGIPRWTLGGVPDGWRPAA